MKMKFIVLVMLLCLSFSSTVFAWNYVGHVLIAQIAYDQLSSDKKIKVDILATRIFNLLPPSQQVRLNDRYPNTSTFAKVALLPDVWRRWHVGTLFTKFDANMPADFIAFSDRATSHWHFVDIPYPANKHCRSTVDSDNAVWAIQKISSDLEHTDNQNTHAMLLIMLAHYIGDIHQPLHTMTNVSQSCAGDRGGNDFCIRTNASGNCIKNLHSLWDSGVGYLNANRNIKQLAYGLEQQYPMKQFSKELQETNAMSWVLESNAKATFIYSLSQYTTPSPAYYQQGQTIAKSQLILAGYRLSRILNKYV